MSERITIRLPEELLQRVRKKAAAEGRTLTALIEDGLWLVVAEKKAKPRRRVRLPVSSATGGFFPGVDISDSARFRRWRTSNTSSA